MATLKSPRPTPHFYMESQVLSTKKERSTPREQMPPRPPVKSSHSVSRVFANKQLALQKAQPVSFKKTETSLRSRHYNESSHELYFDQCFEVECRLGVGSFGEVFKVRSKENGKQYAVKKSRERFRGESDRQIKLEEVKKHEQLPKHPNCVRFIKAWEERQHLYIQTELCETSLSNYAEQNHDIPEKVIWNYLVDLLLAVRHLHDHDLIHLDIKPANIFISKEGTCKLGDFGLVLDLKKGNISEALEGDPKYLAPELMEGKFSKAADIFSLGISILELACDLDLPRGGDCWHLLRSGQIPQEFLNKISPELADIIKLMMHPDPRQRPSTHEILQKPAIHRVYLKRRFMLSGKYLMYGMMSLFQWVFSTFVVGINYVVSPVKHFIANRRAKSLQTPRTRKRIPFDNSFSDDEFIEEDSACSLAMPLSDMSSSSENSFMNSSSIVNSTPSSSLRRHLFNQSLTPSKLSAPSAQSSAIKRSGIRSSARRSNPNRSLYKDGDAQDDDDLILRNGIGPKNLLSVFDEIADKQS